MQERYSIAVDMDGVIADILTPWVDVLRKKEGETLSVHDITDWDIGRFCRCGEKALDYLNYDLFRRLPVIPGAKEVLKRLQEYYDIYIVTSATQKSEIITAKYEWLDEHFPFIEPDYRMFVGKKDPIYTDYLIDDGIHNLEVFKGIGILFDQPYNRFENRFIRARNWKEIERYFIFQAVAGNMERQTVAG